MLKINTEAELRFAILQLEIKQAEEGKMLKDQFLVAYESIKPVNLLKSTILEATKSRDLQDNLLNASIGLGTGYLSKVLFNGMANSPVKKFLGTAVLFSIKSLVAQNPEFIKSAGQHIFKILKSVMSDDEKNSTKDEINEPAAT
jgi:hypothetical protein